MTVILIDIKERNVFPEVLGMFEYTSDNSFCFSMKIEFSIVPLEQENRQ